MSWYMADQEWPSHSRGDGALNSRWLDAGTVIAALEPMRWPVSCARCPARTSYYGFGPGKVAGQIELWHQGWRRDPETGNHYCPTHAPAVVSP